MKLNRLNHTTSNICHIFCGWELIFSYGRLEKLGDGKLVYGLLAKELSFNGKGIDKLPVCAKLDDFLADETRTAGIDKKELITAVLEAGISFEHIDFKDRVKRDVHYDKNHNPIKKGRFNRCRLNCECRIKTNRKEYVGRFDDIQEWPENWRV